MYFVIGFLVEVIVSLFICFLFKKVIIVFISISNNSIIGIIEFI